MEATVLIKVLDESEGTALSFDMSDFDFLSWQECKAFFWDQRERFEILKSSEGTVEYNEDIPQEGKEDWKMYWVGDGVLSADALLAWKILLANGYKGYLLWDIDPSGGWNTHVILTDYVAWPTANGS